jgi:hypothetical protein
MRTQLPGAADLGVDECRAYVLSGSVGAAINFFAISFDTLNLATFFAGTRTASPVIGFRPMRALRVWTEKVPNPRSSTRSPRLKAAAIECRISSKISSP